MNSEVRAMIATRKPPRPNRRAIAAPNPGPIPTISATCFIHAEHSSARIHSKRDLHYELLATLDGRRQKGSDPLGFNDSTQVNREQRNRNQRSGIWNVNLVGGENTFSQPITRSSAPNTRFQASYSFSSVLA